jgi:pseudo-rSAM protein
LTSNIGNSYWFWVEPYVHIALEGDALLLYNTLSGEKLEYFNRPGVIRLARKLIRKKNLRVIKLTGKQLTDPSIGPFTADVKTHFMGDMEDVSRSARKPVQLTPVQNIQADVRKVKKGMAARGKNILTYLSEITFYINNYSSSGPDIHSHSSSYLFKQYLFPLFETGVPAAELEPACIGRLLDEIRVSDLKMINIVGGNIFEHSQFSQIISLLNEVPVVKAYHILLRDVVGNLDIPAPIIPITDNLTLIRLHVTFPLGAGEMEIISRMAQTLENVTFVFAVGSEIELEQCEDIVSRLNLSNIMLQPYYNRRNVRFLKENVFISRESILEADPGQKEILTRMSVNKNYFGKLTVLSNGAIHSDLNAPAVGNAGKDSIHEAIYRELFSGKSWRRVRTGVLPCKKCLYNLLCPPLSNYETHIGRNNLCSISDHMKMKN